jgi:type IV pilus assembly protein PilM
LDWKQMLKLTKAEVVGLDIGSSSVKAVQLHEDETGYAVTSVGIAEISTSEDNKNHSQTNIIRAIRECFESIGGSTEYAVCSVNGTEVAIRDFQFPSLSNEELGPAVALEASQVCPFNAADGAVDYHLISNDGDHAIGVLVAATNTLIKDKVKLAADGNFRCVLMDVDGLALLNCFTNLADEPRTSKSAILNIGSSYTTVAIMGKNGQPFIRDMNSAGSDILKEIAAESGMSQESVKEILFEYSTSGRTKLHDSMEKACQKLIVDIKKTLRYYATQEKSTQVDKIFVCGGFALAKGFVEILNDRLGAETILWNPFEKINCEAFGETKDFFDKKGPALAVATGLAMRSI